VPATSMTADRLAPGPGTPGRLSRRLGPEPPSTGASARAWPAQSSSAAMP